MPSNNHVKFHYKKKKKKPISCSYTESTKKNDRRMTFFPNYLQIDFTLIPICHPILANETCIYDMMVSKFYGILGSNLNYML